MLLLQEGETGKAWEPLITLLFRKLGSIKKHTFIYTEWFMLCGSYCTKDFQYFCDQKSSYKHVSDSERLRTYDGLKLRIKGKDYWKDRE
jgi:hypothetical protein